MKRKALGRGLGALIPGVERAEGSASEIDIDQIVPNPQQPRLRLDEKSVEELAASIRQNGVLQPVLVRPSGKRYQLVAGERRLAAAQRAGLMRIPAIVRHVPDEKLLELALVENIQREQLNPIEEAQAFQKLLDTLRVTQEDLAARLGKERSTVTNSLRLLKLPAAVRTLVAEGSLSAGHARALLASNVSPGEMGKVAQTILEKSWSVRETERWAQRQSRKPRATPPLDPNLAAAADQLRVMLGTKVEFQVARTPKGSGSIRIHFYSQEDLIRIYSLLTGKISQKTGGMP
jgi:ParB family chromosome partitioning protein